MLWDGGDAFLSSPSLALPISVPNALKFADESNIHLVGTQSKESCPTTPSLRYCLQIVRPIFEELS